VTKHKLAEMPGEVICIATVSRVLSTYGITGVLVAANNCTALIDCTIAARGTPQQKANVLLF